MVNFKYFLKFTCPYFTFVDDCNGSSEQTCVLISIESGSVAFAVSILHDFTLTIKTCKILNTFNKRSSKVLDTITE